LSAHYLPTLPAPPNFKPGCAAGYYSRTAEGDKLGACKKATGTTVAAAGPINDGANIARECLDNSIPDVTHGHCECKAGYYVLLGGQTPRCIQCTPGSYTDAPNLRLACKLCSVGKIHNAAHTACSEQPGGHRGAG
jgi:hypothetical protein